MLMKTKTDLEDIFSEALEEKSLEDILEDFDVTPLEVLMILYEHGHIDDEILEVNYDASGRS